MIITNIIKDGTFINTTKKVEFNGNGSGDELIDWDTTLTVMIYSIPTLSFTTPGLPDDSPRNLIQLLAGYRSNAPYLGATCGQNFTLE